MEKQPHGRLTTSMGNGKVRLLFFILALYCLSACSSEQKYGVSIETNPSEASFWLDGQFQGYTPKKVNLTKGKHTFSFTKEDYLRYEKTVEVEKGAVFRFDLNPREVEVEFKFNERPDVFYIDDKKISTDLVKLPYKKMHIFAFKQKYEFYETDFFPKSKIYINLKPSRNGKFLLQVSKKAEFYISGHYIQDLDPSREEVFFMKADVPIDMDFKPKDKDYFEEHMASSVPNMRLVRLKIDFAKEKFLEIYSEKEANLVIRSKSGKVTNLIFVAGEKKPLKLLEKEYTFDIRLGSYDKMTRIVDISKLGNVIDLGSLFKGGLDEANRH